MIFKNKILYNSIYKKMPENPENPNFLKIHKLKRFAHFNFVDFVNDIIGQNENTQHNDAFDIGSRDY